MVNMNDVDELIEILEETLDAMTNSPEIPQAIMQRVKDLGVECYKQGMKYDNKAAQAEQALLTAISAALRPAGVDEFTTRALNADEVGKECRAAFESFYEGYYLKRDLNGRYSSEKTGVLWNCWWGSWEKAISAHTAQGLQSCQSSCPAYLRLLAAYQPTTQPNKSGALPDVGGDVYIWSMEHNAWWRQNSCGYTTDSRLAGLYSRAEAQKICEGGNHKNERIVEIKAMQQGEQK